MKLFYLYVREKDNVKDKRLKAYLGLYILFGENALRIIIDTVGKAYLEFLTDKALGQI